MRTWLIKALKTGLLVAPYEGAAVRAGLGGDAATARAGDTGASTAS